MEFSVPPVKGIKDHFRDMQPCGAPVKITLSVWLFIYMKQLSNGWTDFNEI